MADLIWWQCAGCDIGCCATDNMGIVEEPEGCLHGQVELPNRNWQPGKPDWAEHPCDECDKPAGEHRCDGCENRALLPLPAEESWQCPACQGWSNADAIMCIRPGCGEARPEQVVSNAVGCSLCQTPLDEWGNPVPCPHCTALEAENTRLRGEVIKLRQEVWNNREEIESLQDQRQEWIDLCATLRGDRDILIAAVMDANYSKIFGLADTHAEAIALAEETQQWICSECGYPNAATDKTCVSSVCSQAIEEAKEVGDE